MLDYLEFYGDFFSGLFAIDLPFGLTVGSWIMGCFGFPILFAFLVRILLGSK